jgi:hypothetical protein
VLATGAPVCVKAVSCLDAIECVKTNKTQSPTTQFSVEYVRRAVGDASILSIFLLLKSHGRCTRGVLQQSVSARGRQSRESQEILNTLDRDLQSEILRGLPSSVESRNDEDLIFRSEVDDAVALGIHFPSHSILTVSNKESFSALCLLSLYLSLLISYLF